MWPVLSSCHAEGGIISTNKSVISTAIKVKPGSTKKDLSSPLAALPGALLTTSLIASVSLLVGTSVRWLSKPLYSFHLFIQFCRSARTNVLAGKPGNISDAEFAGRRPIFYWTCFLI